MPGAFSWARRASPPRSPRDACGRSATSCPPDRAGSSSRAASTRPPAARLEEARAAGLRSERHRSGRVSDPAERPPACRASRDTIDRSRKVGPRGGHRRRHRVRAAPRAPPATLRPGRRPRRRAGPRPLVLERRPRRCPCSPRRAGSARPISSPRSWEARDRRAFPCSASPWAIPPASGPRSPPRPSRIPRSPRPAARWSSATGSVMAATLALLRSPLTLHAVTSVAECTFEPGRLECFDLATWTAATLPKSRSAPRPGAPPTPTSRPRCGSARPARSTAS